MKILCTRPYCNHPVNHFQELKNKSLLQTVQQKYCISCGMPLILAGRYLPLELLGKGGFGAAYLAIDRYSPTLRKCVVKQFQPEGNLGEEELKIALELFEREALVLDNLGNKHPQIPDLFAYFPLLVPNRKSKKNKIDEQYFYLVQEFIDGQDLEQELLSKGAFSEKEVTEILQEVLKILDFVHHNGSIHRDIKPSNIMRNNNGLLYLLDFGAVKIVTSNVSNPLAKSTGIYSMGFAPPEQMAGAQVFPSTDFYALAVTCVTLLTAKPVTDLYDAYSNSWRWRHYVQVGDRLGLTLEKMLQHNPARRFQTAKEALAIIDPQGKFEGVVHKQTNATPKPLKSPPNAPIKSSGVTTQEINLQRQELEENIEVASPPSKSKKISTPLPPLSYKRVVSGTAFVGFQVTLSTIALLSFFPSLSFSIQVGILGGFTGLIVFALWKRLIEKFDLILVGGISLGLVYFLPPLHGIIFSLTQLPTISEFPLFPVILLPVISAIVLSIISIILLFIINLFRKIS